MKVKVYFLNLAMAENVFFLWYWPNYGYTPMIMASRLICATVLGLQTELIPLLLFRYLTYANYATTAAPARRNDHHPTSSTLPKY